MKKILFTVVLTGMFFLTFVPVLWAPPLPPPHNTVTPIDGGVTALLGLGLIYGIRKLLKAKKDQA